jgi:glutamine amidotransferase
MITIIDYGMGNIRSVEKAIELYTKDVQVSSDPATITESTALVMPGDGAFGHAMENLHSLGWVEPLKEYLANNGNFLGICLGYQLLFSTSEEFGSSEGLDVVKGNVVKFDDSSLKVPHMGWNTVDLVNNNKYFDSIDSNNYFYFIHSYYPQIIDKDWIVGEVNYGINFPCVVGKGNIIATQFHPEKSHKFGLKIIENFVTLVQ